MFEFADIYINMVNDGVLILTGNASGVGVGF
jgi:hypothetical protein